MIHRLLIDVKSIKGFKKQGLFKLFSTLYTRLLTDTNLSKI